jgi:cysteine-rich repeat protein
MRDALRLTLGRLPRPWRSVLIATLLLSSESAQATTFAVNSSVDAVDANPGDGICETLTGNGLCSLRGALEEAGTVQSGEAITIVIPPGTYPLTLGTVTVHSGNSFSTPPLSLAGQAASNTIIDGGGINFEPRMDVTVQRVTVQNGQGIDFGSSGLVEDSIVQNNQGRGVSSSPTLVRIVRSTIRGNTDSTGCGGGVVSGLSINVEDSVIAENTAREGGGLCAGEWISVTRSLVSNNRAIAGDGGGISAGHGAVLLDSIVSGNSAFGRGGGVRGPFVITTSSLFDDNTAMDGGGVFGMASLLSNTTISGNRATRNAGGIQGDSGTIASSTITGNVADSDGDGVGEGGGIVATSNLGVRNSIVAGNIDRGGEPGDCAGELLSEGYNLIESSSCAITGDSTGNIFNANPLLGPLQSNGGPTRTHALLAGSPAINAGNPAGCLDTAGAVLTVDQRGVSRPQFGRCDIGAFESACGNSQIDLGEQCDEGDTLSGDCCSPNCQLDAPGTPCMSDGEPCTFDACEGTGTCTHLFPPDAGCREPGSHAATVAVDDSDDDRSDNVAWKWKGLGTLEDFGNPSANSSLTLCLADAAGSVKLSATMPSGGICARKNCWQATRSGYRYAAPALFPDGMQSASLRASSSGYASITLKGKGALLSLSELPVALPATMRLLRSDSPLCWESRFTSATRNDAAVFRSKSQ